MNHKTTTIFLFFCYCFVSFSSFAQDSIVIKGKFINNTKYAKVIMKKFAVGNFAVGGATIKKDSFALKLPPDIPVGVYRFQYAIGESEKYLDLVINGKEKEINFTLLANEDLALPKFLESEENKNWYQYIEDNRNQLERISLLNQFINAYPNANATVVIAAEKEWEMEKAMYFKNFAAFKTKMQDTWAYEMVANRPYIFVNPKEDLRIQDFEKRERFWDGFDANNSKLLNTPLYTEHILNYLRYWMNPNMNFSTEEKIEGFKRGVDVVIRKFAGNPETHEFAFKYLTLGFKEIGEETVLQYLDENYKDLANQCFDKFERTAFEKRMIGYATIKVGNKAPDFELNVQSEKFVAKSLYKVKTDKTLVVFWSSTCPHCLEEMPKLNDWAAKHSDIKMIAVSVDTDKVLHTETITRFPNLIHTCDYKGWDTEAANKYFIAATPTFILTDKDKTIEGKYSSWEQVLKRFEH